MMKKKVYFLVFSFPLFINASNMGGINKNRNLLEQNSAEVMKTNAEENTSVKIGGDTCKIFSSDEGNPEKCWCPRGYIMCNEEDVLSVQKKLSEIAIKEERLKATPKWLQRLCDDSEKYGFKGMSVIIDYELSVICKEESTTEFADLKIIAAPDCMPLNVYEEEKKEDPVYSSTRKCSMNHFFLCKPVSNDVIQNCLFTPWTEWSECKENQRKRWRKVLRSSQNSNTDCLWENEIVDRNIMVEIEKC